MAPKIVLVDLTTIVIYVEESRFNFLKNIYNYNYVKNEFFYEFLSEQI